MVEGDMSVTRAFQCRPLWVMAGVMAGVCGWIGGASKLSSYSLRLASGVSPLLVAGVILLALLFFAGRSTWRRALYARNDFDNVSPWGIRALQRGVSALIGVGLVALVAWVVIDSHAGAKVTLLCTMWVSILQWCAYCLHMLRVSPSVAE